jgi:hypothetical protein
MNSGGADFLAISPLVLFNPLKRLMYTAINLAIVYLLNKMNNFILLNLLIKGTFYIIKLDFCQLPITPFVK